MLVNIKFCYYNNESKVEAFIWSMLNSYVSLLKKINDVVSYLRYFFIFKQRCGGLIVISMAHEDRNLTSAEVRSMLYMWVFILRKTIP